MVSSYCYAYCSVCDRKIRTPDPPPYRSTMRTIMNKRVKVCNISKGKKATNKKIDGEDAPDVIPLSTIQKRSEDSGISQRKIISYLKKDDDAGKLLRRFFYKSPIKQGKPEKMAFEYIKKIPDVEDACNLPNFGKSALQVRNGKPCKYKPAKKNESKSIDFQFNYNGYNVYISHKYTHESGGGQEDFKRELSVFLDDAKSAKKTDKNIFIAIGDGKFNEENEDWWKQYGNQKTTFAIPINLLKHLLQKHL